MTQKCPKYTLLRKRYQLGKLSMVPTASYLGRASGGQGLEGGSAEHSTQKSLCL